MSALREALPWIAGDLRLRSDTLEAVLRHARECYPSECCGFLIGPREDPLVLSDVIREQNEADKFHALDPETFPRTGRSYFKINELRAQRTFAAQEEKAMPIKVIYHSHCDAGAHFSQEDAETFARDGTLMWPCAFLVVSVVAGTVEDWKLWVHRPVTNHFDEARIHIER